MVPSWSPLWLGLSLSEGEQQRRGGKRHTEHDPLHSRGGGDGAHERVESRRGGPCTEDRRGTRCSLEASHGGLRHLAYGRFVHELHCLPPPPPGGVVGVERLPEALVGRP